MKTVRDTDIFVDVLSNVARRLFQEGVLKPLGCLSHQILAQALLGLEKGQAGELSQLSDKSLVLLGARLDDTLLHLLDALLAHLAALQRLRKLAHQRAELEAVVKASGARRFGGKLAGDLWEHIGELGLAVCLGRAFLVGGEVFFVDDCE